MTSPGERAATGAAPARPAIRADFAILALCAVGCLGFAARVVYATLASGTNDILTWERFAHQIEENGLLYQYVHDISFNHPPLMGWLARVMLGVSRITGLRFAFVFKLPVIAADIGAGLLLFHAWARRAGRTKGALAFALYGLSPISFLVSAHHGNTDSICAMLVLASVVLAECHDARFAAGLALGAAINVKLIPVFCIPALLLSGPSTVRAYTRFLAGLSLGVIPFVPVLVGAGPEFYRNAIEYNSNPENWGIPYLLRTLHLHRNLAPFVFRLIKQYPMLGRQLIIRSAVLAAILFGPTRRLSPWALVSLCLALFLVLAPGFGVQYLVYLAPVLFAVAPWRGFRYACISGLFVGTVYYSYWDGSVPYHTQFMGPFPEATIPLGIITWAWLVGFVGATVAEGAIRRSPRANAVLPEMPSAVDA